MSLGFFVEYGGEIDFVIGDEVHSNGRIFSLSESCEDYKERVKLTADYINQGYFFNRYGSVLVDDERLVTLKNGKLRQWNDRQEILAFIFSDC